MGSLPKIEDYADASYNPFTAAATFGGEGHVIDPFPELARMRRIAPVWPIDIREHFKATPDSTTLGLTPYTVLGYDEVVQILGDQATWSNAMYRPNMGIYFGDSVTVMDQPEHGRFRRIFQKAFTPTAIVNWGETLVPRMINRLIDGFAARGRAELVGEFTLHFPFHFIHELLGLPLEDRTTFHKLAFGQITMIFDREHGMEAVDKLKDYLTAVVHHRREEPQNEHDFIHIIANAEAEGEKLPDNVVISFFRQLMNAAGDTSYHGFSNLLTALLTHPEQLEAVRRDRKLIPQAIDESLRWEGAILFLARTPTRDVELAGVKMKPGDNIHVVIGAANRDENAYPDPDRFDIFRQLPKRHTAFGFGPHVCIGQHLARLEMTIALNALLDRLPNLRLDTDMPPPVIQGLTLRAPHAVHVRFDA